MAITESSILQAERMYKKGFSTSKIARALGVSTMTIQRIKTAHFDYDKYRVATFQRFDEADDNLKPVKRANEFQRYAFFCMLCVVSVSTFAILTIAYTSTLMP